MRLAGRGGSGEGSSWMERASFFCREGGGRLGGGGGAVIGRGGVAGGQEADCERRERGREE